MLRIDNNSAKENESWVDVVTPRLLQLPPHCRACHPLILCIVGTNRVNLVLLVRLYCMKTYDSYLPTNRPTHFHPISCSMGYKTLTAANKVV